MKAKQVISYNIKKTIPLLGLAGATLFMDGCKKEDPVPTRDIELTIAPKNYSDVMYMDESGNRRISDVAKGYADDPTVRTIYIVPEGNWMGYDHRIVQSLRKNCLEYAFNYSPKFRGKGDLNFYPGFAARSPEDSLWYVSKGFTINKRFQDSKQR